MFRINMPQIDSDNTSAQKKIIKKLTKKQFRKLGKRFLDDAPKKNLYSWHY